MSQSKTAGYTHYWYYQPRGESIAIRGFDMMTRKLTTSFAVLKRKIKEMEAAAKELEKDEQGGFPIDLMPDMISKRAYRASEFEVEFHEAENMLEDALRGMSSKHPAYKTVNATVKRLEKILPAMEKARESFRKNRGKYKYRGGGVITRAYLKYIQGLKLGMDTINQAWLALEPYVGSEDADASEFGFTDDEWAKVVAVTKKIVQAAMSDKSPVGKGTAGGYYDENLAQDGIIIRGPMGTGKPIISMKEISFNGDASKDLDHETFYLTQHPESPTRTFSFCKTARKPYDAVVVSVLAAIQKIAPNALKISSDGGGSAIKRVYAEKLAAQWGPTIREKLAKFPPKAMDFNRLQDSDGFWNLTVGDAERLNAIRLKVDRKTDMGDLIFFLNMAGIGWEEGRRG